MVEERCEAFYRVANMSGSAVETFMNVASFYSENLELAKHMTVLQMPQWYVATLDGDKEKLERDEVALEIRLIK